MVDQPNFLKTELLFIQLAPSLSDVMFGCEWAGQLTSCKKLFKEFWTDEGLCFTFNILNASEVYREEG